VTRGIQKKMARWRTREMAFSADSGELQLSCCHHPFFSIT
jgi:hypothetical protein